MASMCEDGTGPAAGRWYEGVDTLKESTLARNAETAAAIVLSRRQSQLIRLIAEGRSSTEIGIELGISGRTARMHADVLRTKLGAVKRSHIPARFHELTGINPLTLLDDN